MAIKARRNDAIQLEVVGENVQNHALVLVEDQGSNILLPLDGLLNLLIQSNHEDPAERE